MGCAGGKTAMLKTLGVSVLMAQAGMYLHVNKGQPHASESASSDGVMDRTHGGTEPKVCTLSNARTMPGISNGNSP